MNQPTPPTAISSSPLDAPSTDTGEGAEAFLVRGLELEEGLLEAGSSLDLLDAVLTYLVGPFDAAAFFLVQGAIIVGREARGDPILERLVLPSDSPTTFGRAVESRQPYFGPIEEGMKDATVHRRATRPVPEEIFCVPVVVDGTCVGLIYADRFDRGAPIDPSLPYRLGRMVGVAFLDLFSRDLEGIRAESGGEQRAPEDEARSLVRRLAGTLPSDPGRIHLIEEVVKLGSRAMDPLIEFFPGQVDELVFSDPDRARKGEGHGALMDAVARMGAAGTAVAVAALSDSNHERRRYGAVVLAHLPGADAIGPLVALLDDPVEEVADQCAAALSSLRRPSLIVDAYERIGEYLPADVELNRRARARCFRVAAALGCVQAIDALVCFLPDPVLGHEADHALAAICFDSPRGKDRVRAWRHYLGSRIWYREKMARERFALQALELGNSRQRFIAAVWLERMTGNDYGFRVDAPKKTRQAAVARWRSALSL